MSAPKGRTFLLENPYKHAQYEALLSYWVNIKIQYVRHQSTKNGDRTARK